MPDTPAVNLFKDAEVYTIREFADRLRVTERQARRWVYESQILRTIHYPRGRRVLGSDANEFVASRLGGGTDDADAQPAATERPSRARPRHSRTPSGHIAA
jgi:hypothetical protein